MGSVNAQTISDLGTKRYSSPRSLPIALVPPAKIVVKGTDYYPIASYPTRGVFKHYFAVVNRAVTSEVAHHRVRVNEVADNPLLIERYRILFKKSAFINAEQEF